MFEFLGSRYEALFETVKGHPFYGRVMPVGDQLPSATDLSLPRYILHTQPEAGVVAGDVFTDATGRLLMLGLHEQTPYRVSHKLFLVTDANTWSREAGTIDPLTGLRRGTGRTNLGRVYGISEVMNTESADPGLRTAEERFKVLTNVPLQLGDVFNGRMVKRVGPAFGLTYAEVQ